ncbi:MAG: aldehyde ferredoxin oxidoreductase family protein [Bacillota bacterium]
MDGWMGTILEISLNKQSYKEKRLDFTYYAKFLGGRGLGVRLYFDYAVPQVAPLSSENPLIFAAGPLTGTLIPSTGRLAVVSKSPLTNTIFDSNAGGFWGAELKKTGYDAIIIRGSSDQQVRLKIRPGKVEFIPAQDFSGLRAAPTWDKLKQLEPGCKHVYIGPAGENQVRMASITVGKNRNFGRGGLGAVLGQKNVKAISIQGDLKVGVNNLTRARYLKEQAADWLANNSVTGESMGKYGTSILLNLVNEAGLLPTRNFQETKFAGADKISGENLAEKTVSDRGSCYNCPIVCSRKLRADKSEEKSSPEFESLGHLGSNLGIDDLESVGELNHLCNQLGLDTISTGSTIAALIEMVERGYYEYPIEFGQAEKVKDLIAAIAERQGIGDELAEGSLRFSERKGYSELAMQVKGLDIPAFDPRGMKGQALGYMTSNRGACHIRANMFNLEMFPDQDGLDRYDESGKAALLVELQDFNAILDSLIVCKFTMLALAEGLYQEMLEAVTGATFTDEEFISIGTRIWTLERLFNLQAGFSREDDYLPERFSKQKGSGPSRDSLVDQDKLLTEYYFNRDWDHSGKPNYEQVKKLGLQKFSGNLQLEEN